MTYPTGSEPGRPPSAGATPPWAPTPAPFLPAVVPQQYSQLPQQVPVVHHVHHVPPAPKSLGVALLFWFLLGAWGADQFYVNRVGPAIGIIALNLLGWTTIWIFGIGLLFWIPLAVWLIVDVCLLSGQIDQHNRAAAAAAGYGPGYGPTGGYRPV